MSAEAGVVVRTGLLSVPSVPRALPAPLCSVGAPHAAKVNPKGQGVFCLLFRDLHIMGEYSLLKGSSNDPLYFFFNQIIHYETIFFQLPGRATSFDSQGSCPSPKPPSTP